jgi:RNA polymerase sigma-70 factor (ECF subfamily)
LRYHTNKEDAVAVLNRGFLKILNKLDTRGENVPFEAWIRRIMINTVIDEFRKNRRRKEVMHYTDWEEPVSATGEELDFNEADQRLDAEAVEALIQALSPMSRQVFNLFAIDGYAHQEIADRLGISVGTSKWHVSNARKILQQQVTALMKQEEKLSL